ncbi:hypothetical protein NEOLEDRAFT_1151752 [Neolentinus lepideus HHB14362 ss-1]|uniref:Uncharacterized protein n=1 Tax=Neolentinus lepideus HHB14362 ss-1 TaxID=1314782 RepID=A0A165NM99_9AGAM|nr:hypothetical protein NEOLEDRAFT_1151752 [Neolentinus lepideus HHB14362 ss-1]
MAQAQLYAMTEVDTWGSSNEFLTGEFDGEPDYLMGSISDDANDCIYFSVSSQAGSDTRSDLMELESTEDESDRPTITIRGEDHHIPDDPPMPSYTHDQLASLHTIVVLMQVKCNKHLAYINQLEVENKQLREELEIIQPQALLTDDLHSDLLSLWEEMHQWLADDMPQLYAVKDPTKTVVKEALGAGDNIPTHNQVVLRN